MAGRLGRQALAEVMHSLKSYTANRLSEAGIEAPVWQDGYHDRALRGERDYLAGIAYLIDNPRRAGLVDDVLDYPYLVLPKGW